MAKILAGGKSLVLQKINREHSGNYTCIAYNLEGEQESNTVKIQVQCEYYMWVLPKSFINREGIAFNKYIVCQTVS